MSFLKQYEFLGNLMSALLRFFLTKPTLNYTLFAFLFILGVISYTTIPKDIYPAIKINKVQISGGYAGASVDTLNKMVVKKLEKKLRSLNGVKKIDSYIVTSGFVIILTLEESVNKVNILNSTKDIISNSRVDLPSDMDEPTASLIDITFPLIDITISSATYDKEKLITISEKLKNRLSTLDNISQVSLYENRDKIFELTFDSQKMDMYGLNKQLTLLAMEHCGYF